MPCRRKPPCDRPHSLRPAGAHSGGSAGVTSQAAQSGQIPLTFSLDHSPARARLPAHRRALAPCVTLFPAKCRPQADAENPLAASLLTVRCPRRYAGSQGRKILVRFRDSIDSFIPGFI